MSGEGRLRILILGLNYAPELVGISVYTTGLAEELVKRGHAVRVVAGKPYYPAWKTPSAFKGGWLRRSQENGVDVTRVAHYVPANPTGPRRIIHHASFAISSAFPLMRAAWQQRPDVVFTVAPSLIAAPVAWLAAKLSGAKSWLHIQDFEVEAALATGLVSQEGVASRLARRFEYLVLSLFDRVSTISAAMRAKCLEKQVKRERLVEFRNWADIDRVGCLKRESPYRTEWGISSPYVALYSGNIANKQGIDIILSAAKQLHYRRDLTFVVCGNGPYRRNLEQAAAELKNIQFHDLQPVDRLQELLGLASIHLLPQIASAADLVLPSKLTNMLASGRPVIATAAEGTGLADEVAGCGVVVPPGDEVAFSRAITTLLDSEDLRETFGLEARRRAESRWAQSRIIDQFEQELGSLVATDPNPNNEICHMNASYQDLSKFKVSAGFRGRPAWVVLLWQLVSATLFRLSPQPMYGWRRWLLRRFGATVGSGVIVRPTARITYPWKVSLGDHSWIGDDVEIYSLGEISIGPNSVISQRSYLCAGSHDYRDPTFPLTSLPIWVEPQCWIATDCFIGPGVTIGQGTIVAARSTVLKNVAGGLIVAGTPAKEVKKRNATDQANAVADVSGMKSVAAYE